MREIREFSTEDGSAIFVEILEDDRGTEYQLVSRSEADSVPSYQAAIDAVRPAADRLLSSITSLSECPDHVEIAFGIKLSGKVGAMIASASTEGHFNVKLTWKRST